MSKKMGRKKRFKKRAIFIPLLILIVVGGAVGGIAYKKYTDSFAKVTSVAELTSMFSSDNMGMLYCQGILEDGSIQKVNVNSEFNIKNIKVEKGDTVEKGDLLVEYDTEFLQLGVDSCQTQIDMLDNRIKIAENELLTLKGLIPSENAPATQPSTQPQTEPTDSNAEPDNDMPEIPEYETTITNKTTPLAGDGSKDSPFIFNVGVEAVVKKDYMQYLAGDIASATTPTSAPQNATQPTQINSKYAMFHIYGNEVLLYSWLVDGTLLTENDIEDWYCSAGVEISENGNIQVAQGVNLFATLVTYNNLNAPVADDYYEDDSESILGENISIDDVLSQLENDGSFTESNGEISANDNYVYTQSELQYMITSKNDELLQLNFEKRQAEIELKVAQDNLNHGGEVANIRGTVTFVATSADDAIKNGSYITIVNDSVSSVTATVSEKDLPNVKVGMKATVSVDFKETEYEGTIIEISNEISKNTGYDIFGVTDETASYYDVTIELDDKLDIEENSDVVVMIDINSNQKSIWIETPFVRTENGKSYVLVANENNVLEKRYVKIGGRLYSYTVMITEGLSEDDRIALPYGNSTEGKPTKDVTYDEMYSGFFF